MHPTRWGNLGGKGAVSFGNIGGGNGNLEKGGNGGYFGGNLLIKIILIKDNIMILIRWWR